MNNKFYEEEFKPIEEFYSKLRDEASVSEKELSTEEITEAIQAEFPNATIYFESDFLEGFDSMNVTKDEAHDILEKNSCRLWNSQVFIVDSVAIEEHLRYLAKPYISGVEFKAFGSSYELTIETKDEDTYHFDNSFDSYHDFTLEENIAELIEEIENKLEYNLSYEEEEKLKEKVSVTFAAHSYQD